jgi:hypothetical protein
VLAELPPLAPLPAVPPVAGLMKQASSGRKGSQLGLEVRCGSGRGLHMGIACTLHMCAVQVAAGTR